MEGNMSTNAAEKARVDKILAENLADAKRKRAEATNDPTQPKRDLFAEMYPLLAKKLRRGKGGGVGQR